MENTTKKVSVVMVSDGFDLPYPVKVFEKELDAKEYIKEKEVEGSGIYPYRYIVDAVFVPKEIW